MRTAILLAASILVIDVCNVQAAENTSHYRLAQTANCPGLQLCYDQQQACITTCVTYYGGVNRSERLRHQENCVAGCNNQHTACYDDQRLNCH